MGAETALSKSANTTEQTDKPKATSESGHTALKRDTDLSDPRNQIKLATRQPEAQSTLPAADKVLQKAKVSSADDYYPAEMFDIILRPSLSPEERFFDISRASEVVTVNGKRELRKLNPEIPLGAGEHRIRFDRVNKHENKYNAENIHPDEGFIGREFFIYLPELSEAEKKQPIPVVYFLPGVSTHNQKSEDYIRVMRLYEVANHASKKFAVVTPLPARYCVSERSEYPTHAFSMPGIMLSEREVARRTADVHYDDSDLLHAIPKIVAQMAPQVSSDYADCLWSAFSQGGTVLMRKQGEERFKDMMQNLFIIGSTMEQGNWFHPVADYKAPAGNNGSHVTLMMLNGDQLVLPAPDNRLAGPLNGLIYSSAYPFEVSYLGLDALDTWHQDPNLLMEYWFKHLGEQNEITFFIARNKDALLKTESDFNVPVTAYEARTVYNNQDQLWKITPKSSQPNFGKKDLTILRLAHAPHYPPNQPVPSPSGPLVGYKHSDTWTGRGVGLLKPLMESPQCQHTNSAEAIRDELFRIVEERKKKH